MNAGYLWHKYECGVTVFHYTAAELDPGSLCRIMWPAADQGMFPGARRWEGLQSAFLGYVSYGLAQPHACVYDARRVYELVGSQILAKSWIAGADAAEAYEYLVTHFVGVWMGDHTPYLWTLEQDLLSSVSNGY